MLVAGWFLAFVFLPEDIQSVTYLYLQLQSRVRFATAFNAWHLRRVPPESRTMSGRCELQKTKARLAVTYSPRPVSFSTQVPTAVTTNRRC